MDKLCWFCKYFHYNSGSPGYSEYTPGYEMSMSCAKNKWEFDQYSTNQDEFSAMLSFAAVCPDFDLREDLVKAQKYHVIFKNWEQIVMALSEEGAIDKARQAKRGFRNRMPSKKDLVRVEKLP